jgi:hypothetical protein
MLGIGALVGGVIGAVRAFFQFDRVVRQLNTTMGDSAAIMHVSSGMVQGLTGYLNLSREEIAAITKQMGDLRITMDPRMFRRLTMDTIHLSKSMDVAAGSVIDLFDTFDKVYGLPHHRFRNIAASLKFVQEQSGLTGEEVLSLAKSFEDLLARVTGGAKGAKEAALVEMTAMAGAMKKVGIDIQPLGQQFSEALKEHSEKGALFLSSIVENTGMSMAQVQKRMRAGDMILPLELVVEKLKKLTPEYIRVNEERLEEELGMNFAQMMRLRKLRTQDIRIMVKQAKKEGERATLHKKRALATQAALERVWNSLKRTWERLVLSLGGLFARVMAKAADRAIPLFKRIIGKLGEWVEWVASPAGGKAISRFFGIIGEIGSKTFKLIGKMWDTYFKDKVEWLLTPAGGVALSRWFDRALTTVEKMAKGIAQVGDVIANIREALMTDVEKAQRFTTQRAEQFVGMRGSFEKMIARELKREGGRFKFWEAGLGTVEMAATQSNIKAFMGRVAQKKLAAFHRDLEALGLDVKPELKAALIKSYGATLREQLGYGFGPEQVVTAEAPRLREFTPAPGSPSVVTAPVPRVAPPGRVTPRAATPAPTQVSVNAETPTQNRLLSSINNNLENIARRKGRPKAHPSLRPLEESL